MANDINVVVLVGRLVRDCEIRTTNNGASVCRFSIAVNRRKRVGDRWEDEVNFFNIVLWGRQGEALQQYLTKGRQVSIQGELRQNRWEQNGQSRSTVEIMATNVELLSSNSTGSTGNASRSYEKHDSQNNFQDNNVNNAPMGPEDFEDDDIPF